MSGLLWKYYLQDDLERFQQLLHFLGQDGRAFSNKIGNIAPAGGRKASYESPGRLDISPSSSPKLLRNSFQEYGGSIGVVQNLGDAKTSKFLINNRDKMGRTILHHACSSTLYDKIEYVRALLHNSFTDLYAQDLENGWTCLHRALYFGNIAIVRLIVGCDWTNARADSQGLKNLVRIKDKEGNAPFDLYASTLQNLTPITKSTEAHNWSASLSDNEADDNSEEDEGDSYMRSGQCIAINSVGGSEVLTFGSNRNVTLGFGDEDDRQYPERVTLRRPDHLVRRFYKESLVHQERNWTRSHSPAKSVLHKKTEKKASYYAIPTIIRNKPVVIQDVQMSKFHTAVLTADPESNLYMCGHGPNGRLGTGDERTRFKLTCIEGGSLAHKKVSAVALGLNHSLALTSEGELSSWGNNAYGQLGYALPKSKYDDDGPVQNVPRQIFGPLKRETTQGCAASAIHSVAFTPNSLYSFGKNEGQLGIIDADARSLQYQIIPRKIAVSIFTSSVKSVTAINKATACLLENHDLWVFANYGYTKLNFWTENLSDRLVAQPLQKFSRNALPCKTCKVTSAGETLCALSENGEVFTIAVNQRNEFAQDSSVSTTNPSKIRGALSAPNRIWSVRKAHMAARDVTIDDDSTVVLTTEAGTVWRRVQRPNTVVKDHASANDQKLQDYKFTRVAGLTRCIGVRSSAHGAFAAIRNDCDVVKNQIKIDNATLTDSLWQLLSLRFCRKLSVNGKENASPTQFSRLLINLVLEAEGNDVMIDDIFGNIKEIPNIEFDCEIGTTFSNVAIPCHLFMLASRSHLLRKAFRRTRKDGFFSILDFIQIKATDNGRTRLTFHKLDTLTILNFAIYIYADELVDVWNYARSYPRMAARYRLVRMELLRVAQRLEMSNLEQPTRRMSQPSPLLELDMESAIMDYEFFDDANVVLKLADGDQKAHADLLCQRCPFFDGMFRGRAGGMWLAGRKDNSVVEVDLTHIDKSVFNYVMKYMYANTKEDLFEDVVGDGFDDLLDLEQLLDLILDVMEVANELMLDTLSQICQKAIGRFVNDRNICQLLNSVSPLYVTSFKMAGLQYLCLNLEGMLNSRMLDELDESLLKGLDSVVRANQLACAPFVRSGQADCLLHNKFPRLKDAIKHEQELNIEATVKNRDESDYEAQSLFSRTQSSDSFMMEPRKRIIRKAEKGIKGQAPSVSTENDLLQADIFPMDDDPTDTRAMSIKEQRQMPENTEANNTVQNCVLRPSSSCMNSGRTLAESMSVDAAERSSCRKVSEAPAPLTPAKLLNLESGQSPDSSLEGSPWGIISTRSSKGIKDILAEDSIRKPIRAPLDITPTKTKERRAHGSFGGKLSQKDRKKLQTEMYAQKQSPITPQSSSLITASPVTGADNAWQNATKLRQSSESKAAAPPDKHNTSLAKKTDRTASGTQLTMRQTVANSREASKVSDQSPKIIPQVSRAASTSFIPEDERTSPQSASPAMPPSSQTSKSLPKPQIQSIRHTPMPDRISAGSDVNYAISDILTQQQAEKEMIRDATAKRSLQEIQTEQEFQEWWDQESKKMMEQQDAMAGSSEQRHRKDKSGGHGQKGKPSGRGRRGNGRGAEERGVGRRSGSSRGHSGHTVHGKDNEARRNEDDTPKKESK